MGENKHENLIYDLSNSTKKQDQMNRYTILKYFY